MVLEDFISLAMEGYGVVFRNGTLERVQSVPMKRVFSHIRKEAVQPEENIRTIVAFIEAFGKSHGLVYAHLATLLLMEEIQSQALLSSEVMLRTYQSILDIETLLKQDFSAFAEMSVSEQKEYLELMMNSKLPLGKRVLLSKSYIVSALFVRGIQKKEILV